jgi:hypothetical protein
MSILKYCLPLLILLAISGCGDLKDEESGESKTDETKTGETNTDSTKETEKIEFPKDAKFEQQVFADLTGKWSSSCIDNGLHSMESIVEITEVTIVESLSVYSLGACTESSLLYKLVINQSNPQVNEEFSEEYGLPVDLMVDGLVATYYTEGLVDWAKTWGNAENKDDIALGVPVPSTSLMFHISIDEKAEMKSDIGVEKKVTTIKASQSKGQPYYTFFGLYEGRLAVTMPAGEKSGKEPERRTRYHAGLFEKVD